MTTMTVCPANAIDQKMSWSRRSPLWDLDLNELSNMAHIPKLQQDMLFIRALWEARLDDGVGLKGEALERLRNPPSYPATVDDPAVDFALSMFLALEHSSEAAYEDIQTAAHRCFPESDIPSVTLSVVDSVVDHMCINTCVAFVGPYTDCETCPECGTPCKVKVPQAVFHMIPIGPQMQALWHDPDSAHQMQYRKRRTQQIAEELVAYLNAVQEGCIVENDMVLMVSLDGAQLYESKESDCWIYIWIVAELSPDRRYKKKHVLPDASRDTNFISYLFLILGLTDGPGLLSLSRHGCCMHCGLQGRQKPGAPHYYPVLLKPDNYNIAGCDHGNVDIYHLPIGTSANYYQSLRLLMQAPNRAQYEQHHLQTGIVRLSFLLGLQPDHISGVPECFSSEIMHFAGANTAALFVDIWHGEMSCGRSDDQENWPWSVLTGKTWVNHGAVVAALQPHLPEKINTYYKAAEYITWLFGYGPGLFYGLIPDLYYRNFCQFYSITPAQVLKASECFAEWETEFEELYYQHCVDRLHFVRPCIHLSNHLALECTCWTMERTIGNLGQEIQQPSNPFSNLAQQGIQRCQVNALMAILPCYSKSCDSLPRGACELGESYILLCKSDKCPITIPPGGAEAAAISAYLGRPPPRFCRWACLQLPNGQIKTRVSRNVKVFAVWNPNNQQDDVDEPRWQFANVAIVSMYSLPHDELLTISHSTLWSCTYHSNDALCVVDVKSIQSVV
ncbi:uncharacterized protein EDB91DRAFT_1239764 [Suillus paluster]|uniref:uncharacterized protein n=1 Tax=Suillus paluster TaxID=48578 RepID=UPI001B8789E7|nr:uncharacterized protein EDB91DRAFT_1239764 [Suillus paluster]KAG1725615.1 hypothetical protein EDB91DRAFT_1239764 [Suillus paluster]